VRIGIDNISPGEATGRRGPGGMRLYLQSLLTEFSGHAPQHQFILFTPDWADPIVDSLPANVQVVGLPGVPMNRVQRIVYQQIVLPFVVLRQKLDVFFATATVAPLLSVVPVVLAVQFIQFYQWPGAYGRARTAYLKVFLPLSLRKARRAIIFTETAKQDLVRWTGVPANKVSVVPHGLSQDIWRLAQLRPDALEYKVGLSLTNGRPYFLYVSASYGYKNHSRLIQAFSVLKKRCRVPHILLLVGSEEAVSFSKLRTVAAQAGVADEVIFVGHLDPHERVSATYLGADVAVIPSLYETFGFPALEAMACGCPVVTSNSGSMAELAGDAAVLVDPYDINSIADGMERVLTDSTLRRRLVERGRERVKMYTWQRSAEQTLRLLEEAARR